MDNFSKRKRSDIMRSVKSSKNKSTELRLISIFGNYAIKGWRRDYRIYGKPDFVFPKKKLAIFVDGCFWHGHNCRGLKPIANKEYWDRKISNNRKRDKEVNKYLHNIGWDVVRIWECKLKKHKLPKRLLAFFDQ